MSIGTKAVIGLAAGLAAVLVAIVVGSITFRLRGPYFVLASIAVAEIMRLAAMNLKELTNGAEGILSTEIPPFKIGETVITDFLGGLKNDRAGVVIFSSETMVLSPLTLDYAAAQRLIGPVEPGKTLRDGTAIGMGLAAAVNVLRDSTARSKVVVLATDGENNTGDIQPLDAAQMAKLLGVRVYTIGFGTAEGSSFPPCGSQFLGREPGDNQRFGGGGGFGGAFGVGQFGGGGFRRGIDEDTLKQVADMTGGTYYSAESAGELNNVFQNLPTYLITKHETSEVSVIFTALGALLAALAIGLSLLWQPLI